MKIMLAEDGGVMKAWCVPDERDVRAIEHTCPSLESFEAWCETHRVHRLVAWIILSHAESSAEAERLWSRPTPEEFSAVRIAAENLAHALWSEAVQVDSSAALPVLSWSADDPPGANLQPEEFWHLGMIRVVMLDAEIPDDSSLPWEEWDTKCTELLRDLGAEE